MGFGVYPDKTSAAWSSTREGVPIFEEHPEGGTAKGGNAPFLMTYSGHTEV